MLCAPGGALRRAAVALTFALVSCSGGESGSGTLPTAPPTPAPVTTLVPASTTIAAITTVAPTTSVVETSTTAPATTTVPAGVGLSPEGPWHLVDSAPGVTAPGLIYELMPKLWAFIQLEETDASTYPWTLTEADRPIIEAYLQAQLTYYQAITSNPINLDLPGWTQFYVGESAELTSLRERKSQGQVTDMDMGVVLSPQVLSDERSDTYAIVADCILDGAVSRMPDGSLAPRSSVGVTSLGWGARLQLTDGSWRVVAIGTIESACDQ